MKTLIFIHFIFAQSTRTVSSLALVTCLVNCPGLGEACIDCLRYPEIPESLQKSIIRKFGHFSASTSRFTSMVSEATVTSSLKVNNIFSSTEVPSSEFQNPKFISSTVPTSLSSSTVMRLSETGGSTSSEVTVSDVATSVLTTAKSLNFTVSPTKIGFVTQPILPQTKFKSYTNSTFSSVPNPDLSKSATPFTAETTVKGGAPTLAILSTSLAFETRRSYPSSSKTLPVQTKFHRDSSANFTPATNSTTLKPALDLFLFDRAFLIGCVFLAFMAVFFGCCKLKIRGSVRRFSCDLFRRPIFCGASSPEDGLSIPDRWFESTGRLNPLLKESESFRRYDPYLEQNRLQESMPLTSFGFEKSGSPEIEVFGTTTSVNYH